MSPLCLRHRVLCRRLVVFVGVVAQGFATLAYRLPHVRSSLAAPCCLGGLGLAFVFAFAFGANPGAVDGMDCKVEGIC